MYSVINQNIISEKYDFQINLHFVVRFTVWFEMKLNSTTFDWHMPFSVNLYIILITVICIKNLIYNALKYISTKIMRNYYNLLNFNLVQTLFYFFPKETI